MMAQAPATPKARRWRNLGAAALGLPAPRQGLQPSERAALSLRGAAARQPRPRADSVHFLIPLVSPADVTDWQAVTDRLAGTLDSFIAQEDPRWQATICCQDRPPLPDDPRIRLLPFTDDTPGNDKWRKLHTLVQSLMRESGPAYAMPFDADDLLDRRAVSEMLTRAAPGYVIENGYVLDAATSALARTARQSWRAPLQKPFWKLCGSCAAVLVDPARAESVEFLAEMVRHEHRMFPYLCRLAGQPLAPMRQGTALYILNHGENFGVRRGRVSFKTRFVERFALSHGDRDAALAGFPARALPAGATD